MNDCFKVLVNPSENACFNVITVKGEGCFNVVVDGSEVLDHHITPVISLEEFGISRIIAIHSSLFGTWIIANFVGVWKPYLCRVYFASGYGGSIREVLSIDKIQVLDGSDGGYDGINSAVVLTSHGNVFSNHLAIISKQESKVFFYSHLSGSYMSQCPYNPIYSDGYGFYDDYLFVVGKWDDGMSCEEELALPIRKVKVFDIQLGLTKNIDYLSVASDPDDNHCDVDWYGGHPRLAFNFNNIYAYQSAGSIYRTPICVMSSSGSRETIKKNNRCQAVMVNKLTRFIGSPHPIQYCATDSIFAIYVGGSKVRVCNNSDLDDSIDIDIETGGISNDWTISSRTLLSVISDTNIYQSGIDSDN